MGSRDVQSGDALRVLHVVEAFGGGVYEIVRTLAERTARSGRAVGVAYGRRPETPLAVRHDFPPEVELFPLPWDERSPRAQLAAGRALHRLVAAWRPAIVHLHSSFAGAVGMAVVRGSVPTIYSPHAYASAMPGQRPVRLATYRAVERVTSRWVTLVGAVSSSEARFARDVLGARRVCVVPNGIPELDDPPGSPERAGRPLVVALGRICAQRRPGACARILRSLADVADTAWIGGGDPAGSRAASLRAAGVTVSGWLPREEALARLATASVYLHWTAWDGLALSLLDAMARDVVVVGSDIPPTRDLIGRRQVCASEPDAVELIRRVLSEPSLRDALLADQRRRRAAHSAERMTRLWLEVYERLAGADVSRALEDVSAPLGAEPLERVVDEPVAEVGERQPAGRPQPRERVGGREAGQRVQLADQHAALLDEEVDACEAGAPDV
jgi:glycosyltransferase involved in cell wall biosynthesis